MWKEKELLVPEYSSNRLSAPCAPARSASGNRSPCRPTKRSAPGSHRWNTGLGGTCSLRGRVRGIGDSTVLFFVLLLSAKSYCGNEAGRIITRRTDENFDLDGFVESIFGTTRTYFALRNENSAIKNVVVRTIWTIFGTTEFFGYTSRLPRDFKSTQSPFKRQ